MTIKWMRRKCAITGGVVHADRWTMASASNILGLKSDAMPKIDHIALSWRWNISPEKASLLKQFPRNDMIWRYRRLPHLVFADNMTSGTISRRGSKYAQILANLIYPMSAKRLAHKGLLFQRDNVPSECIVNGSKDQRHEISVESLRKQPAIFAKQNFIYPGRTQLKLQLVSLNAVQHGK